MAKIKINKKRCKGCELCVISCPKGLIAISNITNSMGLKIAKFNNSNKCTGCTFCAIVCPDCAIEVFK